MRPCCCTSCCTDLTLTGQGNSVRFPPAAPALLALASSSRASTDVGFLDFAVPDYDFQSLIKVPADYTDRVTATLKPSNSGGNGPDVTDDAIDARANLESPSPPSLVRQVVTWLCVACGPALAAITFFPVIRAALEQQQWLLVIFRQHYAAIFGLPSAALLSFMLVVVFEARFDNIEMEIANVVKFRGASGPIILWILCFLSIASAIKLLW